MSYLSEKDYDFIYSRATRICVDIVIKGYSGVHLTLREIQPYKGKWHLPGGRIQFRESVHHAIRRVAKKELGIDVKIICLLGFMEFPREIQKGQKRHSISIAFLCKAKGTLISKVVNEPAKIHPVHYRFLKEHGLIRE